MYDLANRYYFDNMKITGIGVSMYFSVYSCFLVYDLEGVITAQVFPQKENRPSILLEKIRG